MKDRGFCVILVVKIKELRWSAWKWQTLTDMNRTRECMGEQQEEKWVFPIAGKTIF